MIYTPQPLSRGENISTQHAASLLDPSEEGRMFFHEVNANPAEKAEVLQPLITFFDYFHKQKRVIFCYNISQKDLLP